MQPFLQVIKTLISKVSMGFWTAWDIQGAEAGFFRLPLVFLWCITGLFSTSCFTSTEAEQLDTREATWPL